MIIHLKYLHKTYVAVTIWPFIFVKYKSLKQDKRLINHEKIHLKQQIELLWLPFFVWYSFEFLFKFIRYKNWSIAYHAISFEREAYSNEYNSNYLDNRRNYAFLKYL